MNASLLTSPLFRLTALVVLLAALSACGGDPAATAKDAAQDA